jgi:hypothetical protein
MKMWINRLCQFYQDDLKKLAQSTDIVDPPLASVLPGRSS